MISVVSSGDLPDHGHPRAIFLGGLGLAGRGAAPLVFSTEIAATFIDAGDPEAAVALNEPITFAELDFSTSAANEVARRRFKKILTGVINVRTDGTRMFAFRASSRATSGSPYGPIAPVD